tara:strand:+ start:185 stop:988 length:804 start_codon:yes stop_codon:yes gene_type:complete
MNKKKILITGYKGYIGSFLKKNLKNIFTFKNLNLNKIPNSKSLKNYSHVLHFEFLIKNSNKNLIRNLHNMKKIINICKENKIFLIFPSTASFNFKNKKRISNEIKVINEYTLAKKKCEKLILKEYKKKNLNFTILRIFNVYGGTTNNKYYINHLIKKFKNTTVKIKLGENVRDYIHILDLISLIKKCILLKKNGIFEAGSGKNVSIKGLSDILSDLSSKNHKIVYLEPNKTEKNYYSKSKISKTIKTFKWKPKIKLEQGLRDLINTS